MKHLQTLAPNAFAQLERTEGVRLQWICFRVCEYAVTANGPRHSVVQEALWYLKLRREYRHGLLEELNEMVNCFDGEYFSLKEQAESNEGADERDSLSMLSDEYFRKARVVAALRAAADTDPFEAATEAIYEAAASMDKNEIMFDFVMSIL